MKTRLLPLLMLLLAATLAAKANPVDMRTVREVATKFVNVNAKTPLRGNDDLQLATTYRTESGTDAFHVFNTPNGFVIVSADDCATPILGYSDEGQFDIENIPIQLQGYLQGFVEQIQYGIENHIEDEAIAQQWQLVKAVGRLNDNREGEAVEPLVTALWDQSCYYNAMCPEDENGPCGHCVTGCVAMAMGMIMNYWGFPIHGNGSHTYMPIGYPVQTANFGETTYDWDNMPDQLDETSTQAQIDAVSTLLWHCGVATDMVYSATESSTGNWIIGPSFSNVFNYNCSQLEELGINFFPTSNEWFAASKNSLDEGHPFIYLGYNDEEMHTWVCDGYNAFQQLHFNWGWGGLGNGYFAIDVLNVLYLSFYGHQAIFDIYPSCNDTSSIQINVNLPIPEAGYVIGDGTYSCEQECTLTAIANEGYQFLKWTENGQVISVDPNITFWVTRDRTIEAHFAEEENVCTLVFDLYDSFGDGWQGNGLDVNFGDGTWERLTFGEGSFSSLSRKVVDASHIQLYWELGNDWDECSFTIRFENGAIIYQGVSQINYHFLDYSFDLNCEDQYTPRTITVHVDPETGGTVTGGGVYNPGQICVLYALPNKGHTFSCWEENGEVISLDSIYTFTVGIEDRDLTARFGPYNVSVSSNMDEGGVVFGGGTYNYGDSCTISSVTNEEYRFLYWTENGRLISCMENYSFVVKDNANLVANFAVEESVCAMTIYFDGFNWAGHAMTVNYGNGITESIIPEEWAMYPSYTRYVHDGNHITLSWTNGGVTWGQSFSVYNWNNTLVYSGNWDDNSQFEFDYHCDDNCVSYYINASSISENCGTVVGAGIYDFGSTATLIATAREGYSFINWTRDGEEVSTDATYSFAVTGAGDYVANFGCLISVTTNPVEGGFVIGDGIVCYGTMATLVATPNQSYGFTYWTKDGYFVSDSSTYSFIVTEPATYEAIFLQFYDYITLVASPEEGGWISGEGYYLHETLAEITAIPNTGYTFVNWTRDGEEVSTEATYSFLVWEDAAFVANFEESNITQATNFVEGWTWWSSYIELDDNSLEALQDGLGTNGEIIKSQNSGFASYQEGFGWYGSLAAINNESTYQVKTSAACTVEITGAVANPAEHPITLSPGWTWMGFPWNQSVSIESALEGFEPEANDFIKGRNAYTMYYNENGYNMWFGPLNSLEPGQGYVYYSNSGEAKTLTLNTNGGRTAQPNVTAENNFFRPEAGNYPDNMTVTTVVELDGNELNSESYELAAFANGEVRGSARLMFVAPLNRYIAFLTIAGDEASELRFGLYDTETGTVETQCLASLQYETNAVVGSFAEPYVVRFRSTTGVNDWASSLQIFPNPVERGQTISLGFADEERGEVRVEIVNALGMVETTCTPSQQTIVAPKVAGVYILRITTGMGTCYRRLIVR